ncbi:MAG: glycosyltransferase family 4 protein [Acidobacteriaceae bacterium]
MAARENPLPSLKVVQAVCGTFHHFDLARELDARGLLECIYSTFPWRRLRREGVDRGKVRTFPWIHTPQLLLGRRWKVPDGVNRDISWAMFRSFDAWMARTLPRCDVFVGISGTGLRTGRRAQQRGGKYVCDRGSSHIRYQDRILREEYGIWGVERRVIVDPRMITREEAEYEEADAITVPSEFARRSFLEMGVAPEKLHRIPYGVRLERFRRVGEPSKDRFEVLFAGAVSLQKGVPWLLQAFARVKHRRKRLRLVGAMQPDVKSLLPQLPLENVELVGPVPQAELPAIMSGSHVIVLPSIQDGFGMVMAQAMACGCPVISSRHTGGEDLFADGVEGFVVPIRSPEAIAERLQQLADDPALRQRMSEAALERVRHIGGWREYGERWAELLRQLTAA